MAQNVEIIHHPEKYNHAEYHEPPHGIAIALQAVLAMILRLSEDKRLIGKAECLYEHHHHNRYLIVGSIYTHSSYALGIIGIKPRHQQRTESLIHDPGDTKHKKRCRIRKHLAPQRRIETPAEPLELRHKQHHVHHRRHKIGKKDITDTEIRIIEPRYPSRSTLPQPRTYEYKEQVKTYVNSYVHKPQRRKPQRTLGIAQIAERKSRERIKRDCHRHHHNIVMMTAGMQCIRHRTDKRQYHGDKYRRAHPKRDKCRGIDLKRVLVAVMVGKTEKTRLHPIRQHYKRKRDSRIHISNHAILIGRKHLCVQRHQTPVEKPSYYTAKPIYRSILCK